LYLVDLTVSGVVRANGFDLFRLNRPFGHLFDRRKNPNMAKSRLLLSPSSTLTTTKIRKYSVELDNRIIARLHRRHSGGLKCHALYKTITVGKKAKAQQLFVSKALDYILVHLDDSDKVPNDVRKYFSKLIKLVFQSYPFECIYTDCVRLFNLCEDFEIPVEYFSWNLIRHFDCEHIVLLESLFKVYDKIPLNLLDHRFLKDLPFECTDIEPAQFEGKSNYMLLSTMNNYFAGYFLDVCTKRFGGKEVLPIILFSI